MFAGYQLLEEATQLWVTLASILPVTVLHRAHHAVSVALWGQIWAQSCNLNWQQIAYNQPKKLFWTAKNDHWGDLRQKPDEFTDWERRAHTHSILLMGADGNICTVDSERGATEMLRSLLCALGTLRGSD